MNFLTNYNCTCIIVKYIKLQIYIIINSFLWTHRTNTKNMLIIFFTWNHQIDEMNIFI